MFKKSKLREKLKERGMTAFTLCNIIGMTEPTFYRKLSRGGDFSRKEIAQISDALSLSIFEKEEIFFETELTTLDEEIIKSELFAKEINMDKAVAIHSLKGIFKRILYPELDDIRNELCDENNAEFWNKVDLAAIAFTIRELEM